MAKTSRAQQAVEQAKLDSYLRFELRSKLADILKWVAVIVASWVPLQAMQEIVEALAGKKTVVDASVVASVSLSYSVVTTVGWTLASARARQRKKSLEESRTRSDGLESKLLGLEGGAT